MCFFWKRKKKPKLQIIKLHEYLEVFRTRGETDYLKKYRNGNVSVSIWGNDLSGSITIRYKDVLILKNIIDCDSLPFGGSIKIPYENELTEEIINEVNKEIDKCHQEALKYIAKHEKFKKLKREEDIAILRGVG